MRKIFAIPIEVAAILIAVVIIAIGGAAFGIYQFNKKPKKVSDLRTSFTMSSDELYDAFDQNEKEASEKYIDKVIEVSGVIGELDINKEGSQSVVIIAENAMIGGINAALDAKTLSNFRVGDNIKLKCMCVGFNMEVILNNCVLIDEK